MVSGCRNPVVLRPVGETGFFELVDQGFVVGFMEGECREMFPEVDVQVI